MKYKKMSSKQLDMFNIGMSMAYDRGAISIIELIKMNGMVNNVKNMEGLHKLKEEIEDDVKDMENKLKKV